MTPEKILDYSVKFGVVPFMLYMIFVTRQDYLQTKDEVKAMQELLVDCYRDQLRNIPTNQTSKHEIDSVRLVAVLPEKLKICLN
jgi:hypothetical protein